MEEELSGLYQRDGIMFYYLALRNESLLNLPKTHFTELEMRTVTVTHRNFTRLGGTKYFMRLCNIRLVEEPNLI